MQGAWDPERVHAGFEVLDFPAASSLPVGQRRNVKTPPVMQQYEEFVRLFREGIDLAIEGHTGSGKTIAAWFMALTYGLDVKAAVSQPKRAAQIMNATYARKLVPQVWLRGRDAVHIETVVRSWGNGKQFASGRRLNPRSLVFITSGLFINYLVGYGYVPDVVVFDEVHERTFAGDRLFHEIMMINFARINAGQQPIRVIFASATGAREITNFLRRVYRLETRFGGRLNFRNVTVQGTIWPVENRYLEVEIEPYQVENEVVKIVASDPFRLTAGKISLIWVMGHGDGERIANTLRRAMVYPVGSDAAATQQNERAATDRGGNYHQPIDSDILVKTYYVDGSSSHELRNQAFTPVPNAHIITCLTNFAESSCTIDQCQNGIVTGFAFAVVYSPLLGCNVFRIVRCNSRSIRQQAGRTARGCPGIVWFLFRQDTVSDGERSILANPDQSISDTILRAAALNRRGRIPRFLQVQARQEEGITERDAENSCHIEAEQTITDDEHFPMPTIWQRMTVVQAMAELVFLGLVSNDVQRPAERYLTKTGLLAQALNMSARQAALVAYVFKEPTNGERKGFYCLTGNILISIATIMSVGRNPLLSEKVLRRMDPSQRDTLGGNRKAADQLEEQWRKFDPPEQARWFTWSDGEYEKWWIRGDDGYGWTKLSNQPQGRIEPKSATIRRSREQWGRGDYRHETPPAIPSKYGDHMQMYFIIHALVHEHLKPNTFKCLKRVLPDGRTETFEDHLDSVRFVENYVPTEDRGLGTWCSSLGLHHQTMYQVIDAMQQMTRKRDVNWFLMERYFNYDQNQRAVTVQQIMLTMMEHSTMNVGRVDQGIIFNPMGTRMYVRRQDMDRLEPVLRRSVYVVWEHVVHQQDKLSDDPIYQIGAVSGVPVSAGDNRPALRWNRLETFAGVLRDSESHVTQRRDINALPFHNIPMHRPAAHVPVNYGGRDVQMVEPGADHTFIWTRQIMATINDYTELNYREWAYINGELPEVEPGYFRTCVEQCQRVDASDIENALEYMDRHGPDTPQPMYGITDDRMQTWWWCCTTCHAMVRSPAFTKPPMHNCDTTHAIDRQNRLNPPGPPLAGNQGPVIERAALPPQMAGVRQAPDPPPVAQDDPDINNDQNAGNQDAHRAGAPAFVRERVSPQHVRAAILVQALFRRYRVRLGYLSILYEEEQAVRIQRWARGCITRKTIMRKERAISGAVVTIQRIYRGRNEYWWYMFTRTMILRIQRRVRMNRERRAAAVVAQDAQVVMLQEGLQQSVRRLVQRPDVPPGIVKKWRRVTANALFREDGYAHVAALDAMQSDDFTPTPDRDYRFPGVGGGDELD